MPRESPQARRRALPCKAAREAGPRAPIAGLAVQVRARGPVLCRFACMRHEPRMEVGVAPLHVHAKKSPPSTFVTLAAHFCIKSTAHATAAA